VSKRCSKCDTVKSVEDFYKSSARGTQAWCKPCTREYRRATRAQNARLARLRNYGLTADEFDALMQDQGGRCASCEDDFGPAAHDVHVDHCHQSGKVRGILCRHCNIALGHLRDDPVRILSLHTYIQR
jgi:hypothetical protein